MPGSEKIKNGTHHRLIGLKIVQIWELNNEENHANYSVQMTPVMLFLLGEFHLLFVRLGPQLLSHSGDSHPLFRTGFPLSTNCLPNSSSTVLKPTPGIGPPSLAAQALRRRLQVALRQTLGRLSAGIRDSAPVWQQASDFSNTVGYEPRGLK